MSQAIKRNIRISFIAALFFVCAASFAFASDSNEAVLITPNDSDITLPINAINKDGVNYLFLPSGTQTDNMEFLEGDDVSNYETMTDENIGSLHFFSDDPVNYGMDYIHGSADHSTKAPGSVVLLDENLNVEYEGGVEAIKGRGNSTWMKDKKPYQIKLANKANLLNPTDDSQKAKKWILLANAVDSTLLRNEIAFGLGKEIGLESTPEGRQVDLYYDGDYRGVYYLCEKVEVGNGRVEINDLEKNPDVLTGGYLLEIDNAYYKGETTHFLNEVMGHIVLKSPEEPTQEQLDYINGFVTEATKYITNQGESAESGKDLFYYFDKDSLVKYYITMAYISNIDTFTTSTYFYKPENEEKLYFGPIWDCDRSMYDDLNWPERRLGNVLIQFPEFRKALKEEYESSLSSVIDEILFGTKNGHYLKSFNEYASQIETAGFMDRHSWDVRRGKTSADTHQDEVNRLKEWLTNSNRWMNNALDDSFVQYGVFGNQNIQNHETVKEGQVSKNKTNVIEKVPLSVPKIKAKAQKRKIKVSWKKVKNAGGYQVRFCKYKEQNAAPKFKNTKAKKVTLKKLKRKTKYTVQVRAYCKRNGVVYYSPWSKAVYKIVK